MQTEEELEDMQMDPSALYREEMITDRRVGAIRKLTPVKEDGTDDPARAVVYVGQAQLYTPAGALPLSFEIEAGSLGEAVARFSDAAKDAIDRTMKELEEMRREAASSIVIPQGGGGAGGGSGGLGGGFGGPGGPGGIKLP
ncbi:MAG: hypothetical protein PVF91_10170 [Chromatiales bacterium]|jgi:hypothetical protein